MRKCKVFYDEQYDRLMVAGKSDSDKMAGSVRVLNLILDFNTDNKLVNVELLHALEYVKSLGLDSDMLTKISGGDFIFKSLRNGYEIVFVLEVGKKVVHIPYNVQMPNREQVSITSY